MHTLQELQTGQLLGATHLKLSCGLTQLPEEILELADTLEILDVSGNHLTELPDWLVHLKKLRIGFFSNNDFTQFPAVLGQLPRLEMIGFKACKIQTIAEGAIPVTTRWLILTHNQITRLPASIGQCSCMQKLLLAGNKLTELPAELASCQNLELLRISANRLTHLPAWLFTLPRLSWIAFAGNPCSYVPATLLEPAAIPWQELQLQEQLGEGASGIISKALWYRQDSPSIPQPVAVKVFKGEVTSDGLPQDEMRAYMAAGHHPNLVQVLGKVDGHPVQKQGLLLGLIPPGYQNLGGSPSFETCTRDVYGADTVFTLLEALSICAGIASVAAHLHARGILHGDLYAHNTLVNGSGHALLSDFGAATFYDRADTETAYILERLEVRAFGYLLDDVIRHVPEREAHKEAAALLALLREDCLQPQAQPRPDFTKILQRLEGVASKLGGGIAS